MSVLPDAFETFAGTRLCADCGDRVAAEHYVEPHDVCAGCYWRDKDA